jgi:hypothetical protein
MNSSGVVDGIGGLLRSKKKIACQECTSTWCRRVKMRVIVEIGVKWASTMGDIYS